MTDFSNDPFEQLQQARKAHRHAAHVYAHTEKDSDHYSEAIDRLEKAAITFSLALMVYGDKVVDPEPKS